MGLKPYDYILISFQNLSQTKIDKKYLFLFYGNMDHKMQKQIDI